MTDRELMRQALEALESIPEDIEGYLPAALTDVVIALRERLAQPEQHQDGRWCADLACQKCYSADFRFKHTTPPRREWVGLDAAIAAEREACAALVDDNAMACHSPIYRSLLQSNAAAIRARGQSTPTCPPCTHDCNQGRTCPARTN